MTWAEAQEQMKAGHRVRRKSWSKRQFAFFDHAGNLVLRHDAGVTELWEPLFSSRNATDWELVAE